MLDFAAINNNLHRSLAYCKRHGVQKTIKKAIYKAVTEKQYNTSTATAQEFFLPQIMPLTPDKTDFTGKRLNIVIPSIQIQHVYGGISTALAVFEKMAQNFPYCRIIITDAPVVNYDVKRFEAYEINPQNPELSAKSLIPMHDRFERTFPVGAGDVFVASAWWTAYLLQDILKWQQDQYQIDKVHFFYLIQDFEPGFYPWSSAYALADSTYYSDFNTIAIFNTQLLHDYFLQQGYRFYKTLHFEPSMNEKLITKAREALHITRHEPYKILIYGRPSTQRNCFELVIQALHTWRHTYDNSAKWTIVSAGEPHADIDLGAGTMIKSVGKLTLDEYAELLTTTSVGLSLMISPHPSYPPLEMAAYGLEVVTNRFGNKDLSKVSDNITTVQRMTPENIAEALSKACEKVQQNQGKPAEPNAIFPNQDPFTTLLKQIETYLT